MSISTEPAFSRLTAEDLAIQRASRDDTLLKRYRELGAKRGAIASIARETKIDPRTVERAVKRAVKRERKTKGGGDPAENGTPLTGEHSGPNPPIARGSAPDSTAPSDRSQPSPTRARP